MSTSVLIVGGGGAGLSAAIAAAKEGANVVLVSKTKAGWNTATAFSGGIFSFAGGGVEPQEHFDKTLEVGRFVNERSLVKTLTEHAEEALQKILSWGVELTFPRPGKASVRRSSCHTLMGGEGFVAQFRQIAAEENVSFIESSVVTELLHDDTRIIGVKAVD